MPDRSRTKHQDPELPEGAAFKDGHFQATELGVVDPNALKLVAPSARNVGSRSLLDEISGIPIEEKMTQIFTANLSCAITNGYAGLVGAQYQVLGMKWDLDGGAEAVMK